jgi:hypothetical protein
MAIKYICDRCDTAYRSEEYLREVLDMDLCYECSTEFENLLIHWVAAGKVTKRQEPDTIDEQLIKILREHLGLLSDEDEIITALKHFMADQFLDLLLETNGRHDNYKRYLHGWNDCLDVLKQKIREWRSEPPDQSTPAPENAYKARSVAANAFR